MERQKEPGQVQLYAWLHPLESFLSQLLACTMAVVVIAADPSSLMQIEHRHLEKNGIKIMARQPKVGHKEASVYCAIFCCN